jgi:hypothetical protein
MAPLLGRFLIRYVRRLLRLAFLAPEIVEAIAAADQPPEFTAEALAERVDLPLLWTAKAKAVGTNSYAHATISSSHFGQPVVESIPSSVGYGWNRLTCQRRNRPRVARKLAERAFLRKMSNIT